MSSYLNHYEYTELMEWALELDQDFEEEILPQSEDEFCMPLSLDSLGMSWADFL